MLIHLCVIGKVKEKWLQAGIEQYLKRLKPYCPVKVFEIMDKPDSIPKERALKEEGIALLDKIPTTGFVVALAIEGKKMTSEELAIQTESWFLKGQSQIYVIIGGSRGISEAVKKRADILLSFSDFTFPHQLSRLLFLEQIYRAFKIRRGEKYHK